jgi:hypothetical protein
MRMATKDIIETYTSEQGETADYVVECEEQGRADAAVQIYLIPRKPRERPQQGVGTFHSGRIINRSGELAREVFDWAESVIIARRVPKRPATTGP